ncbi:hypothetical protein DVK85_10890 [Flavobacterium arcticum]|uniref:Uncharacterized protein n=1 Tax=Flavobacterium arcticum TaxID=1784713 RepID=A0A345HDP7_9FLAO|nr:hypothetical protein [Flavobacterium arcticum]AXG74707.1 hypothetical protein DVK85_10890 [Flavobacterium arcticum]KAF2509794.1 hypothetical protein E0W72_09790 [Flavobacterium arcticum]
MENPSAQKLINKIQLDLFKNGFNPETLIEGLKKLRTYAMEEQNPVATKAIRLTYEHLEQNGAFLIAIPDDEPLEDEEEEGTETVKEESAPKSENDIESLEYLLSLFTDLTNKNNMLDLREYNKAFLAF